MSRKLLLTVLVSAAATLAASFGVASYAFGSAEPPRLRPELPAAQLPTFSLDEPTRVKINNLIAAPGVARFGISAASYSQVRRLANTRVGPFYLIPGSRGVCLVSLASPTGAAGCGDPGARGETVMTLAITTPESNAVIAAGIATAAINRVEVQRRDGSHIALLPVVRGAFVLSEGAGVKADLARELNFVARSR